VSRVFFSSAESLPVFHADGALGDTPVCTAGEVGVR
jgi:hypothetical protein